VGFALNLKALGPIEFYSPIGLLIPLDLAPWTIVQTSLSMAFINMFRNLEWVQKPIINNN
jgi:hypothetical protein